MISMEVAHKLPIWTEEKELYTHFLNVVHICLIFNLAR